MPGSGARRHRAAGALVACALAIASAAGQGAGGPVIVNPEGAKWSRAPNDPAGAESVVLREDARTGGLELLVRYPAGHTFKPHWHDSNERIVLLEGRLSIGRGEGTIHLDPGAYAYLPAGEIQHLACTSKTRCAFYVAWDGKPNSHAAREK